MANSSNITIRSIVSRPLTYEELDANFQELIFTIDDTNSHVDSDTAHNASSIVYDPSNSDLTSDNVQDAIDEHVESTSAHNASGIVYDPSNSDLTSDNVQDAIDELDELGIKAGELGTAATANVEDFDAVGSAAQALVDAKAYTDTTSGVPTGGIIMWSGAVNAVPNGWALCNGSNDTPDLRDRFIVGAGGAYGVGDTGGAANVTLTTAQIPAHNHAVTVDSGGSHNHTASTGSAGSHSHSGTASSSGSHSHGVLTDASGTQASNGRRPRASGAQSGGSASSGAATSAGAHTHSLSINSGGSHSHSVTVANGGAHTHSASSANTGSGDSHENRPPYYALAYIIKL